jgi:hypothetical protein
MMNDTVAVDLDCLRIRLDPDDPANILDRNRVPVRPKTYRRESVHPDTGAFGCFKRVLRQRMEGFLFKAVHGPDSIRSALDPVGFVLLAAFKQRLIEFDEGIHPGDRDEDVLNYLPRLGFPKTTGEIL